MVEIERTALLMHPIDRMFALINDVAAYPDYLNGCERVEILEQTESSMTARLHLARGGIRQSFTTRNTLFRPERIELELVEGPFTRFAGQWQLTALNDTACKVSLRLEFDINSRLAAKAVGRLFKTVGDDLVDAICRRAELGDVPTR